MILLSLAAWACDTPLSSTQVLERANAVTGAFEARDLDALNQANAGLEQALPCTTDKLTPLDVAAILRAFGTAAFFAQDRAGAVANFETARQIDPDWTFDDGLSAQHPLRKMYEGIPAEEASTTPLPSTKGWFTVNGSRSELAPVGRSWILQRFDSAGVVAETRRVSSGETVEGDTTEPVQTGETDSPGPMVSIQLDVHTRPTTQAPVFGGLALGLRLPLAGPLQLHSHLVLDVSYAKVFTFLPMLQVGPRLSFGAVNLGADVMAFPNSGRDTRPVSIGGVGSFGVGFGKFVGDLYGGVNTGHLGGVDPVVGLRVGVGFGG